MIWLCGDGRCSLFRRGGNVRLSFHGFISFVKAEADSDRIVDSLHKYVVKVSHFFTQSGFVNGSDLFEQNHGILDKPVLFGVNVDMRRQLRLSELTCDRSGNDRRTVSVSNVILHNQNGSETALFASDDRP